MKYIFRKIVNYNFNNKTYLIYFLVYIIANF